jgi:hypothetical protein
MAEQPVVGQGLLIIEATRSHSDIPHSVGLLSKSDQPISESSTWQHTTPHKRQTSIVPAGSDSESQQASGCRPHRIPFRIIWVIFQFMDILALYQPVLSYLIFHVVKTGCTFHLSPYFFITQNVPLRSCGNDLSNLTCAVSLLFLSPFT